MKGIHVLLAAVIASELVGCKSSEWGAPVPPASSQEDIDAIVKQFSEAMLIDEYYNDPSTEARNRFVAARLTVTNLRYIQFVKTLTTNKQLLDSATEILTMGLGVAGTVVGATDAKSVLAAVSASVSGAKISIDKNFYYEKTIPALVAAMNASRKEILVTIMKGTVSDLEVYPFEKAVADLHEYYFAGTLLGAIQSIQTDAGVKEAKHSVEIAKLAPVTVGNRDLIMKLTDAIGRLQAADLSKARKALSSLDATKANLTDLGAIANGLQDEIEKALSSGDKVGSGLRKIKTAFEKAGIQL